MATTYDIHVAPLPIEDQRLPRGVVGFVPHRSIAVRGFPRTRDTFLRVLLTEEGTDTRDLRRGTSLPRLIDSNVTAEEDIVEVCRLSVESATEQLRSIQARVPAELPEEVLVSAVITNIEFDADGLGFDLYVLLSNATGQRVPVVVNVPLTSR